jgi:mannose-1-phosphate guanylyltransferase
MTMLEYWVRQLSRQGFEAVIVNAFHLSEQVLQAVKGRAWPIPVEVSLEQELLGTGGGIRYALDFFGDESFVVVNGDILCSMDLAAFFIDHEDSRALVSLMMHDHPVFNNVAVSKSSDVLGFGAEARALEADSVDIGLLAFTGVHCIRPEAVQSLRYGEPADILDAYRHLIALDVPPRAYVPNAPGWREMGSIRSYAALHAELAGLPPGAHPPLATGSAIRIHPSSRVADTAAFGGYVVIGENCRVSAGAVLEDAILWDGVTVAPNSTLIRCIVGDGAQVSGRRRDEVLGNQTPV